MEDNLKILKLEYLSNQWLDQQPLIGFSSNFKLKLTGLNQRIQRCQMKMSNEDDLIWKTT